LHALHLKRPLPQGYKKLRKVPIKNSGCESAGVNILVGLRLLEINDIKK